MTKIPPAMWEDPAESVPDEAREEGEEATEPATPDDGVFKRIAREEDEAVEDPEEQRQ